MLGAVPRLTPTAARSTVTQKLSIVLTSGGLRWGRVQRHGLLAATVSIHCASVIFDCHSSLTSCWMFAHKQWSLAFKLMEWAEGRRTWLLLITTVLRWLWTRCWFFLVWLPCANSDFGSTVLIFTWNRIHLHFWGTTFPHTNNYCVKNNNVLFYFEVVQLWAKPSVHLSVNAGLENVWSYQIEFFLFIFFFWFTQRFAKSKWIRQSITDICFYMLLKF